MRRPPLPGTSSAQNQLTGQALWVQVSHARTPVVLLALSKDGLSLPNSVNVALLGGLGIFAYIHRDQAKR